MLKVSHQRLVYLTVSILLLSFTIFFSPSSVKKTIAVRSLYVGVYWDLNCTEEVSSIDWGNLTPGLTANASVFIRNEALDEPCYMYLTTEYWVPTEAVSYITLFWDYNGKTIDPMETASITLIIKIDPDIRGITEFNFKIAILGYDYVLPGDINFDTYVNAKDAVSLSTAFHPFGVYSSNADINDDGYCNAKDAVTIGLHFSERLE